MKRVAVVGGAGSFGRYLVEGLLAKTKCHVVVCGRSQAKAQAFADQFSDGVRLSAAALDRGVATRADVTALEAFCVIDAAGPFQGQSYDFPRAVIEAGAHYIDLADGRDFVAGFDALDALAKARGVLAVAGASSTPALSHAVLDELTKGWTRVDDVEIAISPGFRAMPLGRSVIAAILSYVGRPVRLLRHGRWVNAPGWSLTVRRRFGDLGTRPLSLCETPDLDLVPKRFPNVRNAVFRAGVELSVLHHGLWFASLAVRARLMRSLAPFAEPLGAAASVFRPLGSDSGGMLVEATGITATGERRKATWTLIAEAGDGPVIPTLPALSVVTGLLDGRIGARGARACVGLVDLATLEAQFKRFDIRTARETALLTSAPLFARVLSGFDAMPAAVRAAHAPDPAVDLEGRVDIDGAETFVGRLIARLFGLPRTASDTHASVTIERDGDGEVWIRRFGDAEFSSRLGAGASANRLTERFGLLTFDLDASASAAGFELAILGTKLFAIPLPRLFAPSTKAVASVGESGRYRFDVTITLPVVGRLVRYRGWLAAKFDQRAGP